MTRLTRARRKNSPKLWPVIDLPPYLNHPNVMNLPRWLQPLFLALALLFAQQTAILHAMSHTFQTSTTQQEQDLPSAKSCNQCIALTEIQSALPAAHPPFIALVAGFITYNFALHSSPAQLALGFSARAPPSFL
jgi:hypothetical protein